MFWEKILKFFGIQHLDEIDNEAAINHRDIWSERRRRLLARRCGPLIRPASEFYIQARSIEDVEGRKQDDTDAYESILSTLKDFLSKDEPKRVFGLGFVGKLLRKKFRKDLTHAQANSLLSFHDHRPYFTYWITTVQILVMVISIAAYGFGKVGFTKTLIEDKVFVTSLNYHEESYHETDNIWLGPRPSDLIHLGAKFTPCMRFDSRIFDKISLDREEEKGTGCCIRPDESGCLQTSKEYCTSKWLSWNESTTLEAPPIMTSTGKFRQSGPVCGQDPNYCGNPASKYPHEWADDITSWPICQDNHRTSRNLHHMSCELVGRPCCIGIFGQCRITTSEQCKFFRGTFHMEATLCSQVSCLDDVCGMVPFYSKDKPDQFYRLFTALFLHAGLLHLAFTIALQYYIMRDIERLLGSRRMAIIYFISGCTGYLASATFVPYHTQVGPSGSHFALLACLVAETINSWEYLEDPLNSLVKFFGLAFGLFALGLLPWIDNYAHIFGFITGLALALALTPYLTPLTEYSIKLRIAQIYICLSFVAILIVVLTYTLYINPIYCDWCKYLDCIPFHPYWCENQDIDVPRLEKF